MVKRRRWRKDEKNWGENGNKWAKAFSYLAGGEFIESAGDENDSIILFSKIADAKTWKPQDSFLWENLAWRGEVEGWEKSLSGGNDTFVIARGRIILYSCSLEWWPKSFNLDMLFPSVVVWQIEMNISECRNLSWNWICNWCYFWKFYFKISISPGEIGNNRGNKSNRIRL